MDENEGCWPARLRAGGRARECALEELRATLLGALRSAFAHDRRAVEPFLEDAVQEALLRILDRLPQFEGRSAFTTWATAIAIRIVASELRRRRWKDVPLDGPPGSAWDGGWRVDGAAVPVDGASPWAAPDDDRRTTAALDRRALIEALREAIACDLTERQRVALLAELGGMPQTEIARRLGSNRNALYKLTHDARKRLRASLHRAGYRGDDVAAAFDS